MIKNKYIFPVIKLMALAILILLNNYSFSQCTNTSSYGSATASPTTGNTVTISSCNYQSEYSTVSGFVAGNTYSLTYSLGGCVTVHSGSNSGPVVAFGTQPLAFTPAASGTYYISYNVNCGSCTTASSCGTSTVITTAGSPPPPAPVNDNACGAISLTPASSCTNTAGTTAGATQSLAGCSGTANDDVWYKFVAAATSQTITVSASASFDPVVEIFSGGACGSLTSVSCNDGSFTTGAVGSNTFTGLTVGNTYWVRIYDYYSGTPATSTFNICVITPTPPPPCTGGANNTCATADPFCTGTAYTYCNTTGVASGGTYGCLISTPNPMWMYLNIATSGNVDIYMQQFSTAGAPIDVDFALYGPYASLAASCPITGATPQVDCSFSAAATETGNIVGAVAGQFYMLLITNYNGAAGYFQFSQVGGAGATNCAIVAPTCAITSVSATPTGCNATNQYTVSGTIAVSNPPTTGTLTVTSSCGGSQTFNAPFAASINYSIANINATGTTCTVTATFSALPACTMSQTYTSPAIPVVDAGANQTVCATTPVTLSGTGATSYTWTGGVTNGTPFTPAATTTYTVTGTNAQGCKATDVVTVTVNPKPTITAPANIAVCAGVAVAAQNFTSVPAGATYTWTNSNTAIGLAASGAGPVPGFNSTNATTAPITSTITVTPTLGTCVGAPITYTITVNPQPTAAFTAPANQCLTGNSFSFSASPSYAGLTYGWTFGDAGTSAAQNPTHTYAASGTYTVTLTTTYGTCTSSISHTVTVNPMPAPVATSTPVSCFGGNNGTATVTTPVTPGPGPFSYQWNAAAGNQTTNPATGLVVGSYTVIVKDLTTNCTGPATVNVTGPTALVVSETHVNPTCAQGTNGTATANPSGGTPTYSYSWNTSPIQTTQTATGLTAGTYTCTVTDSKGCQKTVVSTLVDPAGMVLNASMTQANCGLPDGTATVTVVSGGSGNFSYSWNTTPVQNTAIATGIGAGTYIATVTDVTLGCISKDTIIVTTTTGITANTVFIRDALCNGAANGMAYAYPTGGAPTYSYSWNTVPVTLNDTLTAAAGTYTVTITDGVGCTGTAVVTIGQPSVVTAAITGSTNETCAGAANGTATAGGVGGTGTYTYSWNTTPVQNTQTANGLAPGTYTVTVKDGNLCSATTTVTINAGPTMSANHTSTNVSCYNGSNGGINETVSGAPGAITYNWMPGSLGAEDPVGLAAGTYTLIANSSGCIAYDTVIITQPTQLVAVIDSTHDVICNGGADGQAFGSASGGTGTYSYSWSTTPVQNTASAFGLPIGTYTLTVTDANMCIATVNANISQPAPLAANTGSIAAYCGVDQGTAWVFPTNGTAPYTFIWDSMAVVLGSNDTLTGLYPGLYHLQVLDNNGCKFISDVTVSAAPGGAAIISATTPVSCFGGSDGTATVSLIGAHPPYTYQWNASAGSQTTNPATGLSQGGPYGVVVTDAFGCMMSTSANITQPAALSLTFNAYDKICYNSCDATVTAIPSGGTSSYSYLWNDPASQVTQLAVNLCPGNIGVTVTDGNGCSISDNITIINPAQMVLSTSFVGANCNKADGSATASVSANGIAPFTYSWSDGAGVVGTGTTLIDVFAGTYFVTATDSLGCQITQAVTIPNLSGPHIDSTSSTDVLCFGGNTGTATINVSGGGTPYVYVWNDPLAQNTPSATNLVAGTYVVDVTDTNGCNLSTSIIINEPLQLILNSGGVDPTCFGYTDGLTWVSAVGGMMPYSYSWNDPLNTTNDTVINIGIIGGGYTATVTDNNGCVETATVTLTNPSLFTINVSGIDVSCTGGNGGSAQVSENNGISPFTYLWNDPSLQTTQIANTLAAGNYNVVATDDNGCIANGSVTIVEPPLLTIVLDTVLDVSCNGFTDGFASVIVNGGSGAYSFTWDLSGSIVSTLQAPSTLAQGTYLVTVTDTNGCSAQLFVTVNEPLPMSANFVASDVLCAGDNSGFAYVTANGGVTPYSYQWDAAAALQQTDTATGLIAGTYSVVITDDNNCTYNVGGIVIDQPQPLSLVGSSVSSACGVNNGEASVAVGGGFGTYNFEWDSSPIQYTAVATTLFAGNYTVIVTDQNGCQDSTNINVVDLGSPTVTIPTTTDVSCNGSADGTATAVVTGGILPYTYSWNTSPIQTTITATGLDALTYSITVTDSNGCIASASTTIQQSNALIAVIGTPTNVSCNGGSNGAAMVMTAGGTSPITYQWNDPSLQITNSATGLIAGTYIVIVTDSNLCTASDTVTITQPLVLTVGLDSLKNINCFGGTDGFIDVNVTGGTFPYVSYAWTPSVSTGQTASGLPIGTYDVVVTDIKGCTATNTYTINEPTALVINVDSVSSTCGSANGSAQVTSTVGGTSPYLYNWNDPANQQTALATNLSSNTYSVVVTDNHGCTISSSITVNDVPGPVIDSFTVVNVDCYANLTGSATIFSTGGSGLSYSWTPSGQITQTASGLSNGVYSVTVTDANGCLSNQGGITISQPAALTADINMPAIACYGQIIQLFGVGNGGTPFSPPANPYNILWGPPFSITSPGPLYDTVTSNTTYNIVVQDSHGCSKFYNESVTVGAPLNISSSNQIVCQGNGTPISATTTGGNSSNPFVYNWLVYDSLTGNTSTPVGVVNPSNPVYVVPGTTTDYMVYVSDGCSSNDTTYITVVVNDTSLVTFSSVNAIGCPPLNVDFKANSIDANLTYAWDFDGDGTTNQTTLNDSTNHVYTNSGNYDVYLNVTNQYGCSSSFYHANHVTVYNVPVANFEADPPVETILNPIINFTDLSTTDVIGWNWDFGDLTYDLINQNPTHNFQDTGFYMVELIVTNGHCLDTITKVIQIKPDFFFAIPNTFTPDGDGVNDIFMPGSFVGVSSKDYFFFIFDRWGEKIWEGHDLEDGWDGTVKGGDKIAQTDTYVYLIKLKGIDGAKREYRGHVNLLK